MIGINTSYLFIYLFSFGQRYFNLSNEVRTREENADLRTPLFRVVWSSVWTSRGLLFLIPLHRHIPDCEETESMTQILLECNAIARHLIWN